MTPIGSHRQNNFNFLRLLFALLVLLSHAPELVDGNRSRELLTQTFGTISFGEFAVDGFFLLSGYLIVQSWHSTPDVWLFLQKRVLRIYPGFIIASLVCALIVGPIASKATAYWSAASIGQFVWGIALLQEPAIAPVFQGTPYPAVNGSMWTISLEFYCYLAVLALGVMGAINRRRIWLFATAIIFAVLAGQKLGYVSPGALLRLASFFFAGGCFYLYRDRIRFTRKAAIAAAVVLAVAMFSWRGAELALAIFGGYLLFYFALTPNAALSGFNKLPDVSYGVYLYGWPVQKLWLWYFPGMSPWVHFMLSSAVCLLLGAVSWYAVEKPFLKLKQGSPRTSRRSGKFTSPHVT